MSTRRSSPTQDETQKGRTDLPCKEVPSGGSAGAGVGWGWGPRGSGYAKTHRSARGEGGQLTLKPGQEGGVDRGFKRVATDVQTKEPSLYSY